MTNLMVVGEAWGEQEAKEGKPFVGPSGELLNKFLYLAGTKRGDVDVTNVVNRRPPKGNEFNSFSDKEIADGVEDLRRRIGATSPNCIIALGNHALEALTGYTGILKRAGGIYDCKLVPGVKVIGAVHPAFILRKGQWNPWYWLNLHFFKRAVAESMHDHAPDRDYNYIIQPDLFTAIDTLEKYANQSQLAFDIEARGFGENTTGRNQHITCLGFAPSKSEALVIPLTRGIYPYWTLDEEVEVWHQVNRILLNSDIKKIIHNAGFEVPVLGRLYGTPIVNIDDTMIMHHERYPEFPNSLATCVQIYTDREYHKLDEEYHSVPDDVLWRYNGDDCMATYEVWEALKEEKK